ncbi:hypothetical protein [Actinopolymorpha alba]|nr:hypothetical protein [Actinopolymorpha alba]
MSPSSHQRSHERRSSPVADAIFTHPLLAEGLNTLFAMFDA